MNTSNSSLPYTHDCVTQLCQYVFYGAIPICLLLTVPPIVVFVRHKHRDYFQKRDTTIISAELGFATTTVVSICLTVLFEILLPSLSLVFFGIHAVAYVGFGLVLTYRVWILFYQLEEAKLRAEHTWRKKLDPQTKRQMDCVQKRFRFIGKIVTSFVLLFTSLINLAAEAATANFVFARAASDGFWVLCVFVFYYRMSTTSDSVHIHEELGLEFGVTFGFIFITLAMGSISVFRSDLSWLCALVFRLQYLIAVILHLYISTIFVVHRNNLALAKKPVDFIPNLKWQHIASINEGYAAFTDFLVKEMSVENILFITELMQIKIECELLQDKFAQHFLGEDLGTRPTRQGSLAILPLPQAYLPQSKCLSDGTGPAEFYFLLFEKYVRSGARMEINIDYETRKGLTDEFGVEYSARADLGLRFTPSNTPSITEKELSSYIEAGRTPTLSPTNSGGLPSSFNRDVHGEQFASVVEKMDGAGRQVTRLLKQSFVRFAGTREFAEFWNQFGKEVSEHIRAPDSSVPPTFLKMQSASVTED